MAFPECAGKEVGRHGAWRVSWRACEVPIRERGRPNKRRMSDQSMRATSICGMDLWDGDPGNMCTRVVQLGNYGRRRPRKGERFITFLEAVATPKGVATPLFDECIGEFPLL